MRNHLPSAVLLLLAAGCAGRDTMPEPEAKEWHGPPVRAVAAANGAVDVVLTAPTLGYRFELQDVAVEGAVAAAIFKLTTPAADVLTGQMITEHRLQIPAERLPAAARTVQIRVATWQDGVHYVMPPEPELAATVRR